MTASYRPLENNSSQKVTSSIAQRLTSTMKIVSLVLYLIWPVCCYRDRIPIGLVFDYDSRDLERAVIQKIHEKTNNNSYFELETQFRRVDSSDSYNVSRALCSLLSKGALTIVGDFRPDAFQTVQDYAEDTQTPIIFLNNPANPFIHPTASKRSMQVFMSPSLTKVMVTMIFNFDWRSLYYFYDSTDALPRMEHLLEYIHSHPDPLWAPEIHPIDVTGPQDFLDRIIRIYKTNKGENVRAILDVRHDSAKWVIDHLIDDKDVYKVRFHFIMPYLSMREVYLESYVTGGVNITGFEIFEEGKHMLHSRRHNQVVKSYDHIAADTAELLVKSLRMLQLHQGSTSVFRNVNGWQNLNDGNCIPAPSNRWRYGGALARAFQNTSFMGRSGYVAFEKSGQRMSYKLDVQEVTMYKGISIVGSWENNYFNAHGEKLVLDKATRPFDNRTRIVTSMDEEPYLMASKLPHNGNPVVGRYRFTGYCSELAELVSRNVGYEYHIRFVKDGEYGRQQPDGTWNGVIGELIKHVR